MHVLAESRDLIRVPSLRSEAKLGQKSFPVRGTWRAFDILFPESTPSVESLSEKVEKYLAGIFSLTFQIYQRCLLKNKIGQAS